MTSTSSKFTGIKYSAVISPQTFFGRTLKLIINDNDTTDIGRLINSRRDSTKRTTLKQPTSFDPAAIKPESFPPSESIQQHMDSKLYQDDPRFNVEVLSLYNAEQARLSAAWDQRRKSYEEDKERYVIVKKNIVDALDADAHSKLKQVMTLEKYTKIMESTTDNPVELFDFIWDHMSPGLSAQLQANEIRMENLSLKDNLIAWYDEFMDIIQ